MAARFRGFVARARIATAFVAIVLAAGAFTAGLTGGAGTARATEPPILRILNGGDYIAEDTLARFEAETGIKVAYETAEGDEAFEARLMTPDAGLFDIVVPSAGPLFAAQVARGFYRAIDRKTLQNWGNLDPAFLRLVARDDPGNRFAVPYLWGTAGFGYSLGRVKAALGPDIPGDSLGLLLDPASARRLSACGIAIIDEPDVVVPAVLAFLGKPPMSRDPADLAAAMAHLGILRPFIRSISGSEYIELLANDTVCFAFGYSGEVLQARSHAEELRRSEVPSDIVYRIPSEGALIWIDMLAMPADAPHPQNAARFLDFMLRPEIIAAVTNTVGFANANALATDLVDEELRNDPAIYPDAEHRRRLYLEEGASPEYQRQRAALWARFKSGKR